LEDETWLDTVGNLVKEDHAIETLETASDYERGLGRMGEQEKGVVQTLRGLAGDITKVAGEKRKCAPGLTLTTILQQLTLSRSQKIN
jgi:hypothetical protein